MELGVVLGVVLIGFVHGVLPDHGWPIAATYALNRRRRFLYGLLAGTILGVGHLISSVVLVLAYFWFHAFAEFAEGPWLSSLAGVLLILLGINEYRHGGHGHQHDHDAEGGHTHDHDHQLPNGGSDAGDGSSRGKVRGIRGRLRGALPGNGHRHLEEEHAERGLAALGMTALLLGFAHEEPIQILAICVGTDRCLELMLVYSLTVIVAIVLPTLLLIAGYERHRQRVERLTPHLPAITAAVLVGMGLAFLAGLI